MNKKLLTPLFLVLIFALLISACGISPWASPIQRAQATATAMAEAAEAGSIVATAAAQATAMSGGGQPASAATQAAPGATPAPDVAIAYKRATRLLAHDPAFRTQGAAAWAKVVGFTFDSLTQDARQPEEETFLEATGDKMTVVSGIQVKATNLKTIAPACFTTDKLVTGNSRSLKPDKYNPISNPSVLYTDNQTGYSGTATVYGDCTNWPNLLNAPLSQNANVAPTYVPIAPITPAVTPAVTRMTMADLAKLGEIKKNLYYPEGVLAGAQILFSQDWSAPIGWTVQKNGQPVSSVKKGEVASIWSPESIRPLK